MIPGSLIQCSALDWVDEHGESGDCAQKHGVEEGTNFCGPKACLEQMKTSVRILLQGIGEDVAREGLLRTPHRVASAFRAAIAGYEFSADEIIGQALFFEAGIGDGTGDGGGSGGMVVVRNIDSFALCESCLLPFRIRCHVGYVPCGERVIGLSKLPRVAEIFAKRLQNPQKFATELVQALCKSFQPMGVGVLVESWHLKWPGAEENNGSMIGDYCDDLLGFGSIPARTCAGNGQFSNLCGSVWDEFLSIIQLDDVDSEKFTILSAGGYTGRKKFCPFLSYDGEEAFLKFSNSRLTEGYNSSPAHNLISHGMDLTLSTVSAYAVTFATGIGAMLRAMGEEPNTEDLRCSALTFVNWLLTATQGSTWLTKNGQDVAAKSYPNGLLNQRNGSRSCLNGSITQSNGKGNGNNSINHESCAQYNGSSNVKDSECDRIPNHLSGSVILTGISNGASNGSFALSNGSTISQNRALSTGGIALHNIRGESGYSCGNNDTVGEKKCPRSSRSTLCESKCATGNGSCPSEIDSISDEICMSEGLMFLELDMSFSSLCEHHLLPFFGNVHLGYFCGKGSQRIDRSVIKKIVMMYSRRLQAQERLTRQVMEAVVAVGGLQGAIVVAEASHMCISSRGAGQLGSSTATVATMGKCSTDGATRVAFLNRISRKGRKKMG